MIPLEIQTTNNKVLISIDTNTLNQRYVSELVARLEKELQMEELLREGYRATKSEDAELAQEFEVADLENWK